MGEEAQVTLDAIDGYNACHDDGNDGSHDDGYDGCHDDGNDGSHDDDFDDDYDFNQDVDDNDDDDCSQDDDDVVSFALLIQLVHGNYYTVCVWYTDNRFDCLGMGLGKINHDQ